MATNLTSSKIPLLILILRIGNSSGTIGEIYKHMQTQFSFQGTSTSII